MNAPVKILYLEDDPADAQLAARLLNEGGLNVDLSRVFTLDAFKRSLDLNTPSLVLADYTVPGVDVSRVLRLTHETRPEVPFVFLSGTVGEETVIETLKMGATDYVLKQRIERLVPAVRRALRESEEQAKRKEAETEIQRLNERLEERVAQRTQELSDARANLETFAHMAAHDIRAPVRAISGYSAIALAEYGPELDATGRTLLEQISQSARRLDCLLKDLLEFCRVNQADLKLHATSLQGVISEVLSLLEPEVAARAAAIDVREPMPTVLGHHATLVLVLNNLLTNALKFVTPGCRPRVRIRAESAPQHPNAAANGFIRLVVEDNGIGIATEDLLRVFGSFQRLHTADFYPGSGLGLAIVKRSAERMGGRAGVDSQLGQGSRFWIDLQRA